LNVPAHPYRDSEVSSAPAPAATARVARDDLVVAILLLVVGVVGVVSGLSMDRQAQLTLGLVLLAFAAKVAWEARRTG
jgi:hypothetical protein